MKNDLKIRFFNNKDTSKVIRLISNIHNEFNLNLELTGLDSDLLNIEDYYIKSNGCFWIVENSNNDIIGTTGIRKLDQFISTCELDRMYIDSKYRGLGLGQKLLDTAIDFASKSGYSIMLLDSYSCYDIARKLYLKNDFQDITRYNDDPTSQIFMKKKL